jgi:hypothetical protein
MYTKTPSDKNTERGSMPQLSAEHQLMLREESGISDEVISARGYHTITNHKELIALGFASKQSRVPGLLLPLHTTDGTVLECVYRPDSPRVEKDKPRKYELKAGQGVRLVARRSAESNLLIRKFLSGLPKARRKRTR